MKRCINCNKQNICVKKGVNGTYGCGDEFEQKPMTNYDVIKNMTVDEMAIINVRLESDEDSHWYETSDGNCFSAWITIGCKSDDEAYQQALQHEIEWLNSESEM